MNNKEKDYGTKVFVNGKGVDEALRRLRKRMEKSGILDIYREKQYFIKPSIAKRKKCSRARYLMQKYIEQQN